MKLSGAKAEAYVRAPSSDFRAVLFYGPDAGLVRERGKAVISAFSTPEDPFSLTELTGDALKNDATLLNDGAKAMSLMGGDPAVIVRDCSDAVAGTVEAWLDGGGGTLPVVFQAGELSPRSKLRKLFEDRADTAAVGCYADEGRSLEAVVRKHFAGAGVEISADSFDILLARLGQDRLAIRQELDKLILYAGGAGGTLSAEDIVAAVGDVKSASLDDIAFSVGGGDLQGLARSLDRAFDEGVAAIAMIRSVQRHLDRLHSVSADAARGRAVEEAMKRLRPPVFYKLTRQFAAQVRVWKPADLARGLALMLEIERDCKSGIGIERAIVERALLQLAQAARRFRA